MKPPIFVRSLSKHEREALESRVALLGPAFVLRRCQILLASASRERAPRIAENPGCGSRTARNAIHDFDERGLGALTPGSSHPKEVHAAFEAPITLKIARECIEQLPHPMKVLRIFTKEDGSEAHCQVDNLALPNKVKLDWLDKVFSSRERQQP